MYRNQYIITSSSTVNILKGFYYHEFGNLHIYVNSCLSVSIAGCNSTEIALIGYAIDPMNPDESSSVITEKLAKSCQTVDEFIKNTQILSGRYVFIFKNDDSLILVGDASHLRQIFYGKNGGIFTITSSPKLFLDVFKSELSISQVKLDILNNSRFLYKESTWYGDESIDNRLKKLLPNHCLNILTEEVNRIPFLQCNLESEEEILEWASLILRNTFIALTLRHKIMQPITSGWDSRVLLAASRAVVDKIEFYVFESEKGESADTKISRNLSRKLNLNFKCIQTQSLREDFLQKFNQEHIVPRILPKTKNIQYHYDNNYSPDLINVNGNCAEIVRCFYGHTEKGITLDNLLFFSGYGKKIPYFSEQIEKWYQTGKEYSKESSISILDLFYWEQRMGNWGANFPFEQDICMEEISPFNNRSLITSILKIDPKKRRSPDFIFIKRLILNLWEDTFSEPINPDENKFKKIINGNSQMKYLALKLRDLF